LTVRNNNYWTVIGFPKKNWVSFIFIFIFYRPWLFTLFFYFILFLQKEEKLLITPKFIFF